MGHVYRLFAYLPDDLCRRLYLFALSENCVYPNGVFPHFCGVFPAFSV